MHACVRRDRTIAWAIKEVLPLNDVLDQHTNTQGMAVHADLLDLCFPCAVAEAAFNIPISTLANPWWIVADAQFMEGHVGE